MAAREVDTNGMVAILSKVNKENKDNRARNK